MDMIEQLYAIFPTNYERIYNYIQLAEHMTHTHSIEEIDEVLRRDLDLAEKREQILIILDKIYKDILKYIGIEIDEDNFILADVFNILLSLEDADNLDKVNKEDILNFMAVTKDNISVLVYILDYIGLHKSHSEYHIVNVSDNLIKSIKESLTDTDNLIDLSTIASRAYHIDKYNKLNLDKLDMPYDFDYIVNIITELKSDIKDMSISAIMYALLFGKEALDNPEEAYELYIVPLIINDKRFNRVNSLVKSLLVKVEELK